MTTELVDALLNAFSWPIKKKTEHWEFQRRERIGRRQVILEEGNWTPWVRIQEYPDKIDIRAKMYTTRNRAEDPLMQMRRAEKDYVVFTMTYKEFGDLMSSLRRWYYQEKCDLDYTDEVAPIGNYCGKENRGLLLRVNPFGVHIYLSSFFKCKDGTSGFQGIKFSKDFCKQLAFPCCVFGNILGFENFFIFNVNIMKQWKGTEVLRALEPNTDRIGCTEEKTEQKST